MCPLFLPIAILTENTVPRYASIAPLFEEYELTAAFENHDHTYKRTHRIRDGWWIPRGVLYLGDGAWEH